MLSFNESKASFSGSPEKRFGTSGPGISYKEFLDNELEEINQAREEITDHFAYYDYQAGFKEFLDALKSRIENAKSSVNKKDQTREPAEFYIKQVPRHGGGNWDVPNSLKETRTEFPYITNAKVRTKEEYDEQISNQKLRSEPGWTPSRSNWYH